MKLKEYQERTLKEVKIFLEQLAFWRGRAREGGEWLFDFAEKAWEKAGVGRTFLKKKDGLGRPLPVFCLKIPTGGGKTLLAVKTIDHVQNIYLQRQSGLVVWIVPTQQIYRQTLTRLADRDDPYRQHLDMVSAGKTLILEKTDGLTPQDVEEHLYVLTILTNPHSKTAMTQLVGRILRQPFARRTHVPALDESYAYCFQRKDLLDEIRKGFKREGLEEMQGRIVNDMEDLDAAALRDVSPRRKFKNVAANMVLPAFVIRDGKDWRLVSYEADILSRVQWEQADVSPLYKLELSLEEKRDVELRTGLAVELTGFAKRVREELAAGGAVEFDFAYAAGHLLDVVPNPWIGYEFVERVFQKLLAKWKGKETVVANNLVFIIEELRTRLEAERDRLAERAFNEMLEADEMRFILVMRDLGMHRLPKKLELAKSAVKAARLDGSQFEMNLFDPVPDDALNSLEREGASFLDEQSQLYFWYRNIPRRGYYVQGWQKSRIYADFVFTTHDGDRSDFRKVFVLRSEE